MKSSANHSEHGGRASADTTHGCGEDLVKQLKENRRLQAVLARQRERELVDQRAHDAAAQHLMDTDPQGHIEMMKPLQERKALVRELPTAVLRHEAALHQELERNCPPDVRVNPLSHGILMARHVVAEKWVHVPVALLGMWLIFSPSVLAHERGALAWSDLVSGALAITFALFSFQGRVWAPWAAAVLGLWVAFAPLAFWASTPAAYANDSLVGTLIVAFSLIIPMRTEMGGSAVPPDWTYNPSTWRQRAPLVVLAAVSFVLSRYMASFQLGHIPSAWDPIFGNGTERVLTSDVSRMFPISDAGLGAYTYLIELLSALMGDERRWRTMPWMVAMFGIVVVPLGIVSTVLVMLQPVAVGAWCTLCLVTALFMLVMVALSLDEVVAMIQFLVIARRKGQSAWRLFWTGGTLEPEETPLEIVRPRPKRPWSEMFWGTSVSWPLLSAGLIGTWVMASPSVFGTRGPAFEYETILGALVVVTAFVAWAEVTRAIRFGNLLLGVAIAVGGVLFSEVPLLARLSDVVFGVALVALSVPRGPVHDRYGTWDPFVV